jgi:hypothetical protein
VLLSCPILPAPFMYWFYAIIGDRTRNDDLF